MTSILGPLVVLALQFSNALDLQRYRAAVTEDASVQCGMWGPPDGVWINLGITVAVAGWAAIVLPLLPNSAFTSALFEHLTLAVTATATVGVAGASWLGR